MGFSLFLALQSSLQKFTQHRMSDGGQRSFLLKLLRAVRN